MAATYNKFNIFVEDLANGVHNLSANTLKLGLTNTSPNAADTDVNTSLSPLGLSVLPMPMRLYLETVIQKVERV